MRTASQIFPNLYQANPEMAYMAAAILACSGNLPDPLDTQALARKAHLARLIEDPALFAETLCSRSNFHALRQLEQAAVRNDG